MATERTARCRASDVSRAVAVDCDVARRVAKVTAGEDGARAGAQRVQGGHGGALAEWRGAAMREDGLGKRLVAQGGGQLDET